MGSIRILEFLIFTILRNILNYQLQNTLMSIFNLIFSSLDSNLSKECHIYVDTLYNIQTVLSK